MKYWITEDQLNFLEKTSYKMAWSGFGAGVGVGFLIGIVFYSLLK